MKRRIFSLFKNSFKRSNTIIYITFAVFHLKYGSYCSWYAFTLQMTCTQCVTVLRNE